ncbi:MAG: hypothetical protein WCT77_00255 [Bacteroidota bacterium]|jgi:hypothetical protein
MATKKVVKRKVSKKKKSEDFDTKWHKANKVAGVVKVSKIKKVKQTKRGKKQDERLSGAKGAMKAGKRVSKTGRVYHESRSNRAD